MAAALSKGVWDSLSWQLMNVCIYFPSTPALLTSSRHTLTGARQSRELGMSSARSQQIPRFPPGSDPDLPFYCIFYVPLWLLPASGAVTGCGETAAGMWVPSMEVIPGKPGPLHLTGAEATTDLGPGMKFLWCSTPLECRYSLS